MTERTRLAQSYENHLADAIRSFATEHAPLLRTLYAPPDGALVTLVYHSFFGHCLDVLRMSLGRQHVEDTVTRLLDALDRVDQALVRARESGTPVDPDTFVEALATKTAS